METIDVRAARRLALARAGLLTSVSIGRFPRGSGAGKSARRACHEVIRRFGYLQLDTVSIAGARSHAIVLLSRLAGLKPELAERLLEPGEPLFEYWGHEASWLPLELYPVFEFRRRAFRRHPWWGDLIGEHPKVAREIVTRIRHEGPLRSVDLEGESGAGFWDLKIAKKVATALWSSGELAIRKRSNFHRTYDLAERVIPRELRESVLAFPEALEVLLLLALAGHGWASTGTLASTWRLRNCRKDLEGALRRLRESGRALPCRLATEEGRKVSGWVRPEDLELTGKLERIRPRDDRGVLLSPFDPLLWDRTRVKLLFGFDQVLEIFKPESQRIYGYYCLPVLAGERLVARFDLKADRKAGELRVLSGRFERASRARAPASDRAAAHSALKSYARALSLEVRGGPKLAK